MLAGGEWGCPAGSWIYTVVYGRDGYQTNTTLPQSGQPARVVPGGIGVPTTMNHSVIDIAILKKRRKKRFMVMGL